MADNSKNKEFLYKNETSILIHSKDILKDKKHSLEEYTNLCHSYEQLLSETKVITKVSDRLQNKLNSANEQIGKVNDELKVNNQQLQETIDELTKARVGRKATTIVILIAIFIFFTAEVFIEPSIEETFKDNFTLALFIKFAVFFILLPVDFLVKKTLMKRVIRQANLANNA